MRRRFFKEDVLEYLDKCVQDEPGYLFMDLAHGYCYTANSRLSLFADETRWAIVSEMSGYGNRSLRVELNLYYFGNCLCNLGRCGYYTSNMKFVTLVDGESLQEIQADFEEVSPSATHVKLRGSCVAIPSRREDYTKWVPDILTRNYPTCVRFEDLGRYLAFEYEEQCRATFEELRTCLPLDLPFLMHINEWHHRDHCYYRNGPDERFMGEKPSSYETFPLIADVLVSRDPNRFKPTLPANNHWQNWPEAGGL